MTREEEIYNEAKKFVAETEETNLEEINPLLRTIMIACFTMGAKWADAHPHWISVEEELPKLNSGMVIVVTYKGDIDFMIYSNSGWHNSKRWCCVKGVITHWMPLPQPPKKGGEE